MIPSLTRREIEGHLAMLLFSALVAGSFSLGARAAGFIDPAALTAVRFLIAALIIGAAALARGALSRQAFVAPWRYAIMGGLLGGYFVLMFVGLRTAAPVPAAAIFTLTPVASAVFARYMLGQRVAPSVAGALALGGAGALWVVFRGDLAALARFEIGRGEAVYILACLGHAFYTPLVRRLNRGESALASTFGTLVGGTVLVGALGAPAILATDWVELPGIVWVTLLYVAVFASAGSFLLLQIATLRLPSAKVMAYTYLTPGWVIGWEVALKGALPDLWALIGFAGVVAALVILLGAGRAVASSGGAALGGAAPAAPVARPPRDI